MIQKLTWIKLADSSMTQWVKTFQLYGGFSRKFTGTGNFIKGTVRIVLPPNFYYKGFSTKVILKGSVIRSLITRQVYNSSFGFSLVSSARKSSSVVIKKKNNVISKHLLGPAFAKLKHKRILTLFKARL